MTPNPNTTPPTSMFQEWVNRALWALVAVIAGAAVTWSRWATIEIMTKPTLEDVRHTVATEAPYVNERGRILHSLETIENKFVGAVEANTQAIVKLDATLENLEKRIKEDPHE